MTEAINKNGVKFIKRFDGCSTKRWFEMTVWCAEQFGLSSRGSLALPLYERTWMHHYPTMYFRDEQQYTLFLLRWA